MSAKVAADIPPTEEQVVSDKTFCPWEPDQQTLFPPSIRDFVPEGHLAHLVAAGGHLRSVLRASRPAALPSGPDDQAQSNFTDPESRFTISRGAAAQLSRPSGGMALPATNAISRRAAGSVHHGDQFPRKFADPGSERDPPLTLSIEKQRRQDRFTGLRSSVPEQTQRTPVKRSCLRVLADCRGNGVACGERVNPTAC